MRVSKGAVALRRQSHEGRGALSVTPAGTSTAFTSSRLSGNVPCSQVLTMF